MAAVWRWEEKSDSRDAPRTSSALRLLLLILSEIASSIQPRHWDSEKLGNIARSPAGRG